MDMDALNAALERNEGGVSGMLDWLATTARRIRKGAPVGLPRVTLHLRNGHTVVGSIVDKRDDVRDPALVVLVHEPRGPADDLLWVRPDLVGAVVLHDAREPRVTAAPGEPSSPLALRRRAAEVAAQITELAGRAVRVDVADHPAAGAEAHLRAVGHGLALVASIVVAFASDDMARAALRERMTSLTLQSGATVETRRDGTAVVLTLPVDPVLWPTEEELRQRLEAVL